MEDNMVVIRDPKTFRFKFDFLKDVDKSLKHKIELIIKTNKSLSEYEIKNKIEQLLSKYKHRSDIYEHGKQQNE